MKALINIFILMMSILLIIACKKQKLEKSFIEFQLKTDVFLLRVISYYTDAALDQRIRPILEK